jgi:hypothetical protein
MNLRRVGWSCLSLLLFVPFEAFSIEVYKANQDEAVTRLKPSRKTSKDTKFVSCFSKAQPTGSYIVRSPILTSPDSLHRAYVEVEAIASRPKDEPPDSIPSCENSSRLFVAGPADSDFKLVYSQAPPDISDGNSLKLVDWSADGTNLLMERTIWGYETEGELTDLVLFTVSSGTVTVPDLQKVLETRFGKDCSSENSLVGFTTEANVVIRVAPVKDTYYNEGATSCVKKRTLLALDAKRGFQAIAQVLPADFKSQPYGHFPERPAPKK